MFNIINHRKHTIPDIRSVTLVEGGWARIWIGSPYLGLTKEYQIEFLVRKLHHKFWEKAIESWLRARIPRPLAEVGWQTFSQDIRWRFCNLSLGPKRKFAKAFSILERTYLGGSIAANIYARIDWRTCLMRIRRPPMRKAYFSSQESLTLSYS